MNFFRFLFSKIFLKNFLLALAIFFTAISLILLYIRIYTHHNRTLTLPDFYGMSLKEVHSIAEKKHLRIIVIDSIFQQNIKKGTIIDQNPPPGFKVKKNRRILLTLNANQPEKILMPNVIGVSLRQAQAILETNGLEIGKLTYIPDMAINNVLYQRVAGKSVAPKTPIYKGTRIDLVLGNGYSAKTILPPRLTGMTLRQVRSQLLQSMLNEGAVIYDKYAVTYLDSANSVVWKQNPDPEDGIPVPLGSSIDLWMTADTIRIAALTQNDTTANE